MRKLPLLLAFLLLALFGTTVPAQAAALAPADRPVPLLAPEDDEEIEAEEPDPGTEEGGGEEDCEPDEDPCEEERERSGDREGSAEDDSCLLKSATAAVSVNSDNRQLRLVVHYRSSQPAIVSIEAFLRGVKGTVRLGTSHTRFGRSGVYRDTYVLAEKKAKRALPAREVSVDLHALNTPPFCRLHLEGAVHRPRR